MIVCWSPKGGSGTTVTAVTLAVELARFGSVVLADTVGDASAVMGIEVDSNRPGLRQWLASPALVPVEAGERLLVDVMPDLRLMPPGPKVDVRSDLDEQAQRLGTMFPTSRFIVDAGTVTDDHASGAALIRQATVSIMVLRPCYLAVQRASQISLKADGFVLVEEEGRSLVASDIAEVLGIPELARVTWNPSVARRVDAGRTKSRAPRSMRPIQRLAHELESNEFLHVG